MNNLTFSQILTEEKLKDKSICIKIAEELQQQGINMTARQIQKYRSGEAVPTYEVAVEIMKIIHARQSGKELQDILLNSKESRKIRLSSKDINQNEIIGTQSRSNHYRITLRDKDFNFLEGTGIGQEMSLKFIEEKITETYGEDKFAFGRYIVDLINEDMKK